MKLIDVPNSDIPSSESPDRLASRGKNTRIGIQEYAYNTLSGYEVEVFTRAFQHKMTPHEDEAPRLVFNTSDIIDAVTTFNQNRNLNSLSRAERIANVRAAMDVAKAQNFLLEHAQPVEVGFPDSDMRFLMKFTTSDWGNDCGAVCFYLQDQSSPKLVPIYIIRCLPKFVQGRIELNMGEMQPWLSDVQPGITYLKEDAAEDPRILERIRDRSRLSDKLERYLNKASNANADSDIDKLTAADIFLLAFIAYMQKYNVRSFAGIAHAKHTATRAKKSMSLNYDVVFSKWFAQSGTDSNYPWRLDAGTTGCHIPLLKSLPPNAVRFLLDVYR